MKIALIEPFFSGSHKQWSLQFQEHSRHDIRIFSLQGRHWKWRMVGGAAPLAEKVLNSGFSPDLFLCSDMLDLTTFAALTRTRFAHIPQAMYFHENQITYPWSPSDQDVSLERNHHYGFINFNSALAADAVFFNSSFHKKSFFAALPAFLRQFPDQKQLEKVAKIEQKSEVLPLGCQLKVLDEVTISKKRKWPTFLWNHRWEYDKAPDTFFTQLFRLKKEGIPFHLIVLGEHYRQSPPIFDEARKRLVTEILHFGYAESRRQYAQWLRQADILPVTSRQEFFGLSVVEAIYCNCHPILPDRLSYPQHIPKEFREIHLYQNEKELYEKILQAIRQIDRIRRNKQYRNFVARYDWSNLARVYDERFEQLIQKAK